MDTCLFFFIFFQAEDGIRYRDVTGVQRVLFRSFPLSLNFGTLADGLGCFPLDNGAYPPQSDSYTAS